MKHHFTPLTRRARSLAEQVLLRFAGEARRPPLFILGLPRSGTTLLYQYVVHRCEVAYFTNGVETHYYAPALTTWLRYTRHGAYTSSDFTSTYGNVAGRNAPHEAGVFWGQFFGYHDYVRYSDLTPADEQRMRRTVGAAERVFGNKPFVTKNVKHLLRVDALSKIFPKAHFLVIERRLQDTALSLLRGRYAKFGRADQWLSARPPEWETIAPLPPAEQIPRQLLHLREKLEHDLALLPRARVHRVRYDEFCARPECLIDRLVRRMGYERRPTLASEAFQPSINTPETEEEEALVATLHALHPASAASARAGRAPSRA